MVALVTDVQYRMSAALIRELAGAGARVYTCAPDRAGAPVGAKSRFGAAYSSLPEEGYEDALAALLGEIGRREGCRPALLPAGAKTLALAARARDRFAALAGLCIPTPDQLDLLNSKKRLHSIAAECGIPLPESFAPYAGEAEEAFFARASLPLVIKPACGEKLGLCAAQRYRIVKTVEQAVAAWRHFYTLAGEAPVVQEYLSGGALGCSVLAERGRIVSVLCHRREREYPISGGPSTCCRAVRCEQLTGWVKRLVEKTGFSGPAMFEFKEDAAGMPRLLECNPRIWGSFPLVRAAGSPLARQWGVLSWNAGNPQDPRPLPAGDGQPGRRMVFFPSDLAAGLHYAKTGRPGAALRACADFLNPAVRDGLFEWRDPRPALAYYRALLKRGGGK